MTAIDPAPGRRCSPCQVRWARAGGDDCWLCGGPGIPASLPDTSIHDPARPEEDS
jgi:hypothetical protein